MLREGLRFLGVGASPPATLTPRELVQHPAVLPIADRCARHPPFRSRSGGAAKDGFFSQAEKDGAATQVQARHRPNGERGGDVLFVPGRGGWRSIRGAQVMDPLHPSKPNIRNNREFDVPIIL